MDPDKTLEMMLADANKMVKDYHNDDNGIDQDEAYSLAESFLELHTWMKKGGFLPKDWKK